MKLPTTREEFKKFEANLAAGKKAGKASIKRYCEQHKACPECGSTSTCQTHCGYIIPVIDENGKVTNEDSYKNENSATCKCGWKGIVHDLGV